MMPSCGSSRIAPKKLRWLIRSNGSQRTRLSSGSGERHQTGANKTVVDKRLLVPSRHDPLYFNTQLCFEVAHPVAAATPRRYGEKRSRTFAEALPRFSVLRLRRVPLADRLRRPDSGAYGDPPRLCPDASSFGCATRPTRPYQGGAHQLDTQSRQAKD